MNMKPAMLMNMKPVIKCVLCRKSLELSSALFLLPCTNFFERFNISVHSLRDRDCNFAREISAWPVKIDLLAHALRLTAVLAITLHQLIADSYQNVFENELSKNI